MSAKLVTPILILILMMSASAQEDAREKNIVEIIEYFKDLKTKCEMLEKKLKLLEITLSRGLENLGDIYEYKVANGKIVNTIDDKNLDKNGFLNVVNCEKEGVLLSINAYSGLSNENNDSPILRIEVDGIIWKEYKVRPNDRISKGVYVSDSDVWNHFDDDADKNTLYVTIAPLKHFKKSLKVSIKNAQVDRETSVTVGYMVKK